MDRAVSSVRDGWLDMHSRGDGLALLGVQRSMVGKARVSTMALVLAAAILLGAGSCESLSSLSFRPAFLESVVSNRRVIAQDADGFYAALPTDEPIRLRMQADFGFVQAVAVNDTASLCSFTRQLERSNSNPPAFIARTTDCCPRK